MSIPARELTRIKRRIVLVMAIVLSWVVTAALCSCATATPQKRPELPELPSYTDQLSAADREKINFRNSIRALDPCAYVDAVALSRIGKPVMSGASGFVFGPCEIWFDGPRITIDIGKVVADAVPRVVGGTTVWIHHADESGNSCYAQLRLNDSYGVDFGVILRRNIGDPPTPVEACNMAADLAAAPAARRTDRPLRAESQYPQMNSRLAAIDPCAVLGKVGPGHRPVLEPDFDDFLFWCGYRLDEGDESSFQAIHYVYRSYSHMKPLRGQRKLTIGGFQALEDPEPIDSEPGTCAIYIATDPPETESGVQTETVEVTARSGCAAATTLAEELTRLYNEFAR
ncbi:hypothetical protein NBRGN_024_00460 [Nocardia brasiliensis NBRC 14402]|nr:hypothetical protein CEQ30_06840 [Nocardia brasiliensis]GAJ80180.1 hypothetical protein NBRGN_024_00460 [Nocardia brasiliensis NBRC 14402]SUB47631.1 Uncharacterised protein [Nocardia brasiliensis]